jgi:type II secretory pathway predicted ATPase ExeA
MFEAHFGFTQTPFRKDLPHSALFPSQGHQELVARLRYAVERAQIILVTGDIGAGKSTAIRAVYQSLSPAQYRFLYVANPTMGARDMYRELLREMQIEPAWTTADSRRLLREAFVAERDQVGRIPTLILDEAHALKQAMLDELRMLHNFEIDARPVFALVLAGHPDLARTLTRKPFEALNQRIGLRYHITGMPWDETRQYVGHHLKVAGVERPLFTEGALRQLFQYSQGVPRKINSLALRALETAYFRKHELVDESTLEIVLAEYS